MSNLYGERGYATLPKNKSSKKKTNPDNDRVEFVVKHFDASWNYTSTNYHTRWENAFRLYNNRRIKQNYEGISNIFVPITFSTIETMVSGLAGGKPRFDFLPPKDHPDQNTDILNALLDNYWDKDQWDIKIQNFIRSMLIYGTSVGYLMWDIDHPVFINVPIRDFFFDPNAVNIENAPKDFYCGRRYLTTVEELKSFEVVDPETGEMKPKYKNLNSIHGSNSNGEETDKQKKDLFYGSTAQNPETTQVEVLEFWTEDNVYSIANRTVCIEDEENPYKVQHRRNLITRFVNEGLDEQEATKKAETQAKGIIPFIIQRDFVDESLFLGKGEVDIISDLQEDLNDFTNQKRDFFSFILNPMWNLSPNKADMIEQIGAVPGRVFPLDPNDLTPVQMPQFPYQAFNEENSIENRIREVTAVDQVVKGVSADTKTTATEIQAQVASAGQRIGMKVTQLENEGFHRLARIVFEMVKLYVTEPTMVRIAGEKGIEWELFDPAEFQGEYEPRVMLQSSVEADNQQNIADAKEMYLALAGDPEVNQTELKRLLLPKIYGIDNDEVDRLLSPPEEPSLPTDLGGLPPQDMGEFTEDPDTGEFFPVLENPEEAML